MAGEQVSRIFQIYRAFMQADEKIATDRGQHRYRSEQNQRHEWAVDAGCESRDNKGGNAGQKKASDHAFPGFFGLIEGASFVFPSARPLK